MPDDHRNDGATQTHESTAASRAEGGAVPGAPNDDSRIALLKAAALSSDAGESRRALGHLLMEGVSPEVIADHYIPGAARSLGEGWCRDEIGFASVTIGSSRLQSMLRELGQFWVGDDVARADAATVLLVVSHNIHHTLGAVVVAGQLRRKGISVRLMLDAKAHEVGAAARRGHYDAIFLSASCGEKLESLRQIVDSIRQDQEHATPIVIGGTILSERSRVAKLTGADFATNDPDEALTLCGLTTKDAHSPSKERVS